MSPIRVGLIGLSASAKTAWASTSHLPYLLSPAGRSKYQIVALLNSSVEAARKAIEFYQLPASTKAYGSPSDLAADPDVDLVVCNTRVDVHASTIEPSVRAGKAVFCEWPLTQNAQVAAALVSQAEKAGTLEKTVVGLQGRVSPLIRTLRGVIASGRIGRVLSSEVRVFGGLNDRVILPQSLEYFTKREVGGNIYQIGFAHVFDTVQSVLGDIEKDAETGKAVHGHFQLQHPHVKIRGADGKISHTVTSDVPDLILIAGTLPESETSQKGASLHFRFRRGQPFPGEPWLSWSINGEKGEIRLVSPASAALNVGVDDAPVTVELYDFETDTVTPLEWEWEEWQRDLPIRARNIGGLYEAFAAAREGGEVGYPTFGSALARHRQLEELLEGWKA
ncbi:NAD(P)-binding protein [Echria macrotheca]|uniref:NAD(P)-binding protein n=1 Tax=Echria macrotheca TaxID=438768 RepID=A0AAJ0BIW8_9PEZI|nr:NAD(P)-binding protein [Echria macrotheca]